MAKVVLHSKIGHCILPKPSVPKPDAARDGWELVESRRTRRNRSRQSGRPRRPAPVDLRGRCFNCFSDLHRDASCRRRTRCFRCLELGHQSYACPRRPTRPEPRRHRTKLAMAWRQLSAVTDPLPRVDHITAAAGDTRMECVGMPGSRPRRRRRRARRRSTVPSSDSVGSDVDAAAPPLEVADVAAPSINVDGLPRRVCILDRSDAITRAEADLHCALLIAVVGNGPPESQQSRFWRRSPLSSTWSRIRCS